MTGSMPAVVCALDVPVRSLRITSVNGTSFLVDRTTERSLAFPSASPEPRDTPDRQPG
jgi:hypothetical protein